MGEYEECVSRRGLRWKPVLREADPLANVFVITGTQKFPFNRLIQSVDQLAEPGHVLENAEITAQSGTATVRTRHTRCIPFLSPEEMSDYINAADLVITHGGTGAIMESLQAAKPVIAVARLSKYGEHVDDHQVEIVNQFTKENYVIGLHETDDLERAVKKGLVFTPAKWKHGNSGLLPAIDHAIEDSILCARCRKS